MPRGEQEEVLPSHGGSVFVRGFRIQTNRSSEHVMLQRRLMFEIGSNGYG